VFQHISNLITSVKASIEKNDLLQVIISSAQLTNIGDLSILIKNNDNVPVYVYYTDEKELQRDKDSYAGKFSNLIFCLQGSIFTNLQGCEINESIQEPNSVKKNILLNKIKKMTENIKRKRLSESEQSNHSKKRSLEPDDTNPVSIFNGDFLHRNCGHSITRSCYNSENGPILCSTCSAVSRSATSQIISNAVNMEHRLSTPSSSTSREVRLFNDSREPIIHRTKLSQLTAKLMAESIEQLKIKNASLQERLRLTHSIDQDIVRLVSVDRAEWKVASYVEKNANAIQGYPRSFYSPSFHMQNSGHKMCLRLYPNGDSDARNQHISIFLALKRSDTDNLLSWPFSYQVTVTLVDEDPTSGNSRDIVQTFIPTLTSPSFQRPDTDMNPGYGFKYFISIEEFNRYRSHYVHDNALLIRVELRPIDPDLTGSTGADENDMTPNDRND